MKKYIIIILLVLGFCVKADTNGTARIEDKLTDIVTLLDSLHDYYNLGSDNYQHILTQFYSLVSSIDHLALNIEGNTSSSAYYLGNLYRIDETLSTIDMRLRDTIYDICDNVVQYLPSIDQQLLDMYNALREEFHDYKEYIGDIYYNDSGVIGGLENINNTLIDGFNRDNNADPITKEDIQDLITDNKISDFFTSAYSVPQGYLPSILQWKDNDSLDIESDATYEHTIKAGISNENGFVEFCTAFFRHSMERGAVDTKSLMLIAKSLKGKNTEEELDILEQELDTTKQDSFSIRDEFNDRLSSFAESISLDPVKQYFDLQNTYKIDAIFDNISSTSIIRLPDFGISHLFGFDASALNNLELDVSSWMAYVEVIRSCFLILYYLSLAGFLFYLIRESIQLFQWLLSVFRQAFN